MKTVKTCELTVEEIEEAVKFWLAQKKDIVVEGAIRFEIKDVYDPSDWQTRNPPTPVLGGATFTVKAA